MESSDLAEAPVAAATFDFTSHRSTAEQSYLQVRPLYDDLARTCQSIVREALRMARIRVHSIEARAKNVASFGRKACVPLDTDPSRPKYPQPLTDITDLAATRVITFFPRTIDDVGKVIEAEFIVHERADKGEALREQDRFGYQSVHYLVSLRPNRLMLPEYAPFAGMIAEIQVRTILQHTWAEIEHDIQYKSVETIPFAIRRRFTALAGMLEIADREFQAIQDLDDELRANARAAIVVGDLGNVELTADALKAYLDDRLGPDGRMTDFSYDFMARILKHMGFESLAQVDLVIEGIDDDAVSRSAYGRRMGQLMRFETMLTAGMGHGFIVRHLWNTEAWFIVGAQRIIETLAADGLFDGGRPLPVGTRPKREVLVRESVTRLSSADKQPLSDEIERLLGALDERESKVLRLNFGFDADSPMRVAAIAEVMGLSSTEVYGLRSLALQQLDGLQL